MIVNDLKEAIEATNDVKRKTLTGASSARVYQRRCYLATRDAVLAFLSAPLPSRYFCLWFGCDEFAIRRGTSDDRKRDFFGWCLRHSGLDPATGATVLVEEKP